MMAAWYVLSRYEGHFDQRRLFFALIVGLFGGTLVRAFEVNFIPFESPWLQSQSRDFSFAYTAVGYSLLHALAMQAVVGLKRFRQRPDGPAHGVALGIGFGAMWALPSVTAMLELYTQPAFRLDIPALRQYAMALFFAAGIVLAHAASGAWVGKAAAEAKFRRGVLVGLAWLAPALAGHWLIIWDPARALAWAVVTFGYGLFAVVQARRRVLDKLVPPEARDRLRRQRRREARSTDGD
jgi:hypothetical protein